MSPTVMLPEADPFSGADEAGNPIDKYFGLHHVLSKMLRA